MAKATPADGLGGVRYVRTKPTKATKTTPSNRKRKAYRGQGRP